MGRTLILEVPEDLYEPLVKKAEQTGLAPEELVIKWLVTVIRDTMNDPVENFIGVVSSSIPEWADQHDKYMGEALTEQMSRKGDKGN